VTSPHSENFYDLRKLRRVPSHTPPHSDWFVKGQDYNANFTINICAPVLSNTSYVSGVEELQRGNVSAFYEKNGTMYSIGSASSKPYFRGRKLVLQYTGGSPCPDARTYRKSTLMSLMCDHEAFTKPSVAFVGQINECAYFFEVRTAAACATINQAQALGPAAVFGAIMGVFALVYLVGGVVYQRTVMHARGWRQIPHYNVWAAIVGFVWVRFLVTPLLLVVRVLSPRRRTPAPSWRGRGGGGGGGENWKRWDEFD